ncbi:MAG TPA: flagellar basal body rod protein FlgC, partial [Bryobacteraceae bacterium]
MAAERARTELLVENMANAETTRTPDGGPYRRKDAVFESQQVSSPFSAGFQSEMDATYTGGQGSDVVIDQREPEKRY